MSSAITSEVVAPGNVSESMIRMDNSTWARPISIPATWNSVRIGIRYYLEPDTAANMLSTPRFAMGLCSGTAKQIGDAQTQYFVGVVTNAATWTYYTNAGQSQYYNIAWVPCTKTGSVLTVGSNISTIIRLYESASNQICFVDIAKTTPTSWSFNLFGTNTANPANVTQQTFINLMPLVSASLADYGYGTVQFLPVDEAQSGSLNAVSVWWNHSDVRLRIEDLAVAVLT